MNAKGVGQNIWFRGGPLALAGLVATAVTVTAFAQGETEKQPSSPSPPPLAETLRYLATTDYRANPAYPDHSIYPPKHALAPVLMPEPAFLEAPSLPQAIAIAAWAPTRGVLDEELRCLALNVYFEARSEPTKGRAAVAHVTMNRAASPRFPDTVCAVVRQGGEARRNRCQFSWWCDGRSDVPLDRRSWRRAQAVAQDVYWGATADPTGGALWYHADYVKPYWSRAFARGPRIGQHVFYYGKRPRVQVAAKN